MWVIGLILGMFVGAIGGVAGAILGASAGAALGWSMSKISKGDDKDRIAKLERSLDYLRERVDALERTKLKVSPAESSRPLAKPHAALAVAAEEPTQPQAHPVPLAPRESAPVDLSSTPFSAAAANTEPATEAEPIEPEREATPLQPRRPTTPPPQVLALWNFFFSGNTLVRFGVIVLFFGVAFLLKYASEHIEVPIEARLIAVAVAAIVMLGIGWRLRSTRPGYALIVQGGGIGLLYITIFAAFRLYQLLPAGLVFALLTAMAIFSAALAILQDSRSLAAVGISGGFLAPILASTGGGSHVALFSFYLLLNLGILIISWFKAWRSLNLLGFAFTFTIGLLWGARYYRSEFFTSTEPFLILFFLFYVAIAVLFALRQRVSIKSPVDGTLVFGAPLVAFGLQSAMVHDIAYASAFSALALSGFYLLLARVLFTRLDAQLRLLVESFLALGVVFGTLAIPMALDGRWTAAAWALEGAAIVWTGVRQQKLLARAFGIFLQFAAGVAFLAEVTGDRAGPPLFNSFYLGCLFISGASLFSAWYLTREGGSPGRLEERLAAFGLFPWGNMWWFGGAFAEIDRQIAHHFHLHAALFFVTLSCALFGVLHRRLQWHEAKYTALALLPFMIITGLLEVDLASHPFLYYGLIAWPGSFAVTYWLLRRYDDSRYIAWWHAAALWLWVGLGAWEIAWWIGKLVHGGDVWRLVGWPLLPIAVLAWLTDRAERMPWPVMRFHETYLFHGAIVLAGFLWLWMLHANFTSRADPAPLPYLPLLNPLDLAHGAALLTLFAWLRRLQTAPVAPEVFRTGEVAYVALGSIGLIWLNGVLLRTLHHWAGVPFNLDAMMRSMLVQAALSIFWSILALCTMVTATRARVRPLWISGASLMAVVVIKLFFVDLSNVGGVERIVSFIGVGLLMLVIGYFSPVPPAQSEAK